MSTHRNSTPPAGVIQRVLALISPRDHRPITTADFLQEDPYPMRPRAATSPASWLAEHIPATLRRQGKSSSKASLASQHLSCNLEEVDVGLETVQQEDYASSGARPKSKIGVDGLPVTMVTECKICNIPDSKLTAYCLDCQEALCQQCLTSHEAFKAMRHHNVIQIANYGALKDKVKGQLAMEEYCNKHGEVKRFYCKTCDEVFCSQCILKGQCYDHAYVTLKSASKEHKRELHVLLHQCKYASARHQYAFRKVEELQTKLTHSVDTSRVSLNNSRNEYVRKLDESLGLYESDYKKIEQSRLHDLSQAKQNLQSELNVISDAIRVGKSVAESSKFDIVSKFTVVSKNLQEIADLKIIATDAETLSKMRVMLPSVPFNGKSSWHHIGSIEAKHYLNSMPVVGISAHYTGHITIVLEGMLIILTEAGKLVQTCSVHQKLGLLQPDGSFMTHKYSRLTLHDKHGKAQYAISLHGSNGLPVPFNSPVMTMDRSGRIIVGSKEVNFRSNKPIITIHNPDGSHFSSFIVSQSPRHLAAVSCNEDILVSFEDGSVQLVKYSGDGARIMSPPTMVSHWSPREVWCSDKALYIMNHEDPGRKIIYSYTLSGIYIGQVDIDLHECDQVGVSADGKKMFVLKGGDDGVIQIYENRF